MNHILLFALFLNYISLWNDWHSQVAVRNGLINIFHFDPVVLQKHTCMHTYIITEETSLRIRSCAHLTYLVPLTTDLGYMTPVTMGNPVWPLKKTTTCAVMPLSYSNQYEGKNQVTWLLSAVDSRNIFIHLEM